MNEMSIIIIVEVGNQNTQIGDIKRDEKRKNSIKRNKLSDIWFLIKRNDQEYFHKNCLIKQFDLVIYIFTIYLQKRDEVLTKGSAIVH